MPSVTLECPLVRGCKRYLLFVFGSDHRSVIENIKAVFFDASQDSHSSKPNDSQLEPQPPAHRGAQRLAAHEHLTGALDFKPHQTFEVLAYPAARQIFNGQLEPGKVLYGDVDAVLVEVYRHVLPVIRQLKRRTDIVGPSMALIISIAEEQKYQSTDRIGRPPTIVEQLIETLVSAHRHVLRESRDQVFKKRGRQIEFLDRASKSHKDRMSGTACKRLD